MAGSAPISMIRPARKKQPPAPVPAPAAPPARDGSLKLVLLGWYGVVGLVLSYVLPFRFPFAEGYAKDHWRHALGSLLLAFTAAAALVGTALYLFDANDFKDQIVDYVRTHQQRELVIEGDIALNFFPRLGLDTGRMRLSQRHGSRKFASVENARLYIAWWPLLRRQLQVERVVFDGLHANVVRHADGSSNFDDLLATADQLGDVKFEVEKIRVFDASVHYQDEAAGLTLTLHDLALETGRLADATAGQVSGSFRLESTEPRIDARVRLGGHVLYDRADRRYEVANLEGQAQGEMAGLSDLALTFRGSLTARPVVQQLALDKFSVTARGRLAQQQLDAWLEAGSLQLDRGQWQARAWRLGASLQQPDDSVTATLVLPAFVADRKALRSENVQASLALARPGTALQGQFSSPLQIDFAERQLALGALAGQWSASHPLLAGRLGASASGQLLARLPSQLLRLDFQSRLDDSQFSGHVQLQDFDTPAWAFDLAVDTLDLDRYLVSHWARWLQQEYEPLNLTGLQTLNLRGRLRGDALKLARVQVRQLAAEVRTEPGTLTLEPLSAQLYAGTLQGRVRVAAEGTPRLTLQQKISGVQVEALLADLLPGEVRLSGKGHLVLDLATEGHTLAELRQELQGSASLALANGTLAGLHPGEALVAGRERLGLAGAELRDTVRLTDSTAFSELKASISVAQGQARSSDLLLRAPQFTSRGEGELALENGELALQLVTTVAPGLKRSSAGELADLAGISVPMQITGPWATADVHYRLGDASGATLARLARANQARRDAAPAPVTTLVAAPATATVVPAAGARMPVPVPVAAQGPPATLSGAQPATASAAPAR